MSDIKSIEKIAQNYFIIAEEEKAVAIEARKVGKSEIQRAKARLVLVEKELELAKVRNEFTEKDDHLIQKKQECKELLNIPKQFLDNACESIEYTKNLSKVQKKIAEILKKIAEQELMIGENKLKLADETMTVANERNKLAKIQLNYVKVYKANTSKEKISKAEHELNKQQEILIQARDSVLERTKIIKKNENKLADLKREHANKLSDREKIRHT